MNQFTSIVHQVLIQEGGGGLWVGSIGFSEVRPIRDGPIDLPFTT